MRETSLINQNEILLLGLSNQNSFDIVLTWQGQSRKTPIKKETAVVDEKTMSPLALTNADGNATENVTVLLDRLSMERLDSSLMLGQCSCPYAAMLWLGQRTI